MNFYGKNKKQDLIFLEIKNSLELIYWIASDVDHFLEDSHEKLNKRKLNLIYNNVLKYKSFYDQTIDKIKNLKGIHKDCANLLKDYISFYLLEFDFIESSNSYKDIVTDKNFLKILTEDENFRECYKKYLQKTDIEFYRLQSYQYYSKALHAMLHFNACLKDNLDFKSAQKENIQIISLLKRAESLIDKGCKVMNLDDASLKDIMIACNRRLEPVASEYFQIQKEYNSVYKEILYVQRNFYYQFSNNKLPENTEIELIEYETSKYYGKLNELGYFGNKLVLDLMGVDTPQFSLMYSEFSNNQFDFIKVKQR